MCELERDNGKKEQENWWRKRVENNISRNGHGETDGTLVPVGLDGRTAKLASLSPCTCMSTRVSRHKVTCTARSPWLIYLSVTGCCLTGNIALCVCAKSSILTNTSKVFVALSEPEGQVHKF